MLEKFQTCVNLDECLSKLDKMSTIAISREHAFGHFDTQSNTAIYCFKKTEIIYEYSLKFLIRKEFSYFNELNRFIGMASAGGLIKKWHTDCMIPKKVHLNHNEMIYRTVKLENLQAILMILFIFVTFSFLVLSLECFVYKKVTGSNPSRFWLIVQMIIDPDRHFFLENKMK